MADDEAATVSSATCRVADAVESAGKVGETAEGAGGQGVGAEGPRGGAEDERARARRGCQRTRQPGCAQRQGAGRVYSHSPHVPARTQNVSRRRTKTPTAAT